MERIIISFLLAFALAQAVKGQCVASATKKCVTVNAAIEFDPAVVSIKVGDSVQWTLDTNLLNDYTVVQSDAPFSCTPLAQRILDSGGQKSYTHVFTDTGVFNYFSTDQCTSHDMYGQVLVSPQDSSISEPVLNSGDRSTSESTAWALSVAINIVPTLILVLLGWYAKATHSDGHFSKIWEIERLKRAQKQSAGGARVWMDGSTTAPNPENLLAVTDDTEMLLDDNTYNEFYGRLCVLRHDRNTFAAMLNEMQKRLQNTTDAAMTEKYGPIISDLERLLKLMKIKTATDRTVPEDAMELLIWAHGTLERYLDQQTRRRAEKEARELRNKKVYLETDT